MRPRPMSTHLIASTVLMGLVLGAVYLGIARLDSRERGQTAAALPATRSEATAGRLSETADDPAELGAIFVVLVLAVGAVTLVSVGGAPELLPAAFGIVVALLGLLVTGFLFLGTYVVVRQHGLGRAQGVAAGLFGVGGVGILVVSANLVFGFA